MERKQHFIYLIFTLAFFILFFQNKNIVMADEGEDWNIDVVITENTDSVSYDENTGAYYDENWYYKIVDEDNQFAAVSGYKGSALDVSVPSKVQINGKEYNITELQHTFHHKNVEKVILPYGIKKIGVESFADCSLSSIVIPNSVEIIQDMAFDRCPNLTEITIPNSVVSIGYGAFGSTGLTSMEIPDSVTSIGDWLFGQCSALKSVIIPAAITHIGEGMFYSCNALETIYYKSNKEAWDAVTIGEYNDLLSNVTVVCSEKDDEKDPADSDDQDISVTDPAQVEIPQGPTTYQSKEGADGLIFRLYNVALARDPEKEGYDSWSNSVTSKSQTAADVAHAFFFSTEFKSKEYTDEQYVKMLYETLCGREPDSEGFTYWVKQLRNGVSREYVYKGFAESAEFTKICEGYKIERGNVELTSARDQNPKTANFMSRFYTKVLDRKFDEKGIDYWCDAYVNQGTSINDIAAGFINSPEFKSKELTNEAYITMLYDIFLGRTPDEEGYNYWLKQLQDGQSRESILYGFTGSKEFGTLKASYGL